MDTTWHGEGEFMKAIAPIRASTSPISSSKIQVIIDAAFLDLKFYKYVVVVIEKYIQKLEEPGQILSCLYVIDAIIKQSFTLYGPTKDRFAVRFEANIATWFGKAVEKCLPKENYKEALLKLALAWCTKYYFSVSSLNSLIEKLGPSSKQRKQLLQLPKTTLPPQKKPQKRKETTQSEPPPPPKFFKQTSPSSSPASSSNEDTPIVDNPPPVVTPQIHPKFKYTLPVALNSILDTLPTDVLKSIFGYLHHYPDIVHLTQVSRAVRQAATNKYLWQTLNFSNFYHLTSSSALRIIVFRTLFITPLNVFHLNLSYCSALDETALREIATKCTNLLTLDLHSCVLVTNRALAAVGKYCTKLQKLSLCNVLNTSRKGLHSILKSPSLRNLSLRCCHNAYNFIAFENPTTSLQKLDISCHCTLGSVGMDVVNLIITKIPSLKILKASGVIKGVNEAASLGTRGELQGVELPRTGISVRTMDLWLASFIGSIPSVKKLLDEPSPKLEMRSAKYTTPLMVCFLPMSMLFLSSQIAAERGYAPIVDLLISAGAKLQSKDVYGNTAMGLARTVPIINRLFAGGARPGNKHERDIENILQVVTKYPYLPPMKPVERARTYPLLTFPPHEDTEMALEFVKDNRSSQYLDCTETVLRLLGWFLSSKEYLEAFTTNMTNYRKELIRSTLGRDNFFTQLMPYTTLAEQKTILLQLNTL